MRTKPVRSVPAAGQNGDSNGRGSAVLPELEGLWSASKDAVRHGSVLARIGMWGLGVRLRARLARLFAMVVVAAIVVAIAVTMAVCTTERLLSELAAMLGGGFRGAVLAVGVLLTFLMMLGYVVGLFRKRARAARWRHKLNPASSPDVSSAKADDELDRLRQEALRELGIDKQRVMQRGSAIWRLHPVASLSVGTASGFFLSRWLLATPRKLRRSAVGAMRLAKSFGIASMVNGALDSLGMRSPAAPKVPPSNPTA